MSARVILGVSGASGAILALECARLLARIGVEIDLTLSPMAERTLALEIGPDAQAELEALATLAHGLNDNLLTRAAGVQLKERRPLILLAREAPLTLAHLRNMLAVTEMGGTILPPVPAFYLRPQTTLEIAAQIAARAVDLLRLAPAQATAWATP